MEFEGFTKPLVLYSDSEDESLSDAPSAAIVLSDSKKRKRGKEIEPAREPKLPPLPQTFHSLYATSTRIHPSDDPALHGGRTRQVPHVEGNWPTHVYLEWYPARTEIEILQDIVEAANIDGELHSLLRSELGAQLPLHISLSAPLVLKGEQRSDFEYTLKELVQRHRVVKIDAKIHRLRWERNFDATRWFLVLRLARQQTGQLSRLLDCCNSCASSFELPLLYNKYEELTTHIGQGEPILSRTVVQDRSEAFHISIAWQLAEPSFTQRMVLADPRVPDLAEKTLHFKMVKLKMGNTVKDIELPERILG